MFFFLIHYGHCLEIKAKKGGGVCTFIKNTLDFSEASFSHLNLSQKNIEIQWISIQQKPNETTLVGNCYRLPKVILRILFKYWKINWDK